MIFKNHLKTNAKVYYIQKTRKTANKLRKILIQSNVLAVLIVAFRF